MGIRLKIQLEIIIVAIISLSVAVFVMNTVVKAQKKVFTEHLLRRISEEVGGSPEFTVPDDLAAILLADGLYEWNEHLREDKAVVDIWGSPIRFVKQPLSGLKIQSAGKDAEFDTDDDHSVSLRNRSS